MLLLTGKIKSKTKTWGITCFIQSCFRAPTHGPTARQVSVKETCKRKIAAKHPINITPKPAESVGCWGISLAQCRDTRKKEIEKAAR